MRMIYLVLFCKFLITNECEIVFGRQGPEVQVSDTAPQLEAESLGFIANKLANH